MDIMSSNGDLLIFEKEAFKNLPAFFKLLSSTPEIQNQFLDDPSGILKKHLLNDPSVPETKISETNKLVHSILSNKKFLSWAIDYQTNLEQQYESIKVKRKLDAFFNENKEKIYSEVVKAILDTSDKDDPIISSIKNANPDDTKNFQIASVHRSEDNVVVAAVVAVAVVVVVAAAAFAIPVVALGIPAENSFDDTVLHLSRREIMTIGRVLTKLQLQE
jgi:hypothetical protein